MINAVYQATVSELETVLSARVVSRSLSEGLKQVDKTPQSVDTSDMETILKSHIYRQLQVAMPVEQAKEKINTILEQLNNLDEAAPVDNSANLSQQTRSIEELQEAMRPFNLYFEWSEMQKLRAQIQLIETEHEAGREASQLIASARAQLHLVEQKLEDQLVAQADELSKLEDAHQQFAEVGGSKARRLGRVLKQVEEAQESRQLASGEIERARKLLTDLRQAFPDATSGETTSSSEASEEATPAAESLSSGHEAIDEDISFEGLLLDLDDDESNEEAALLDTTTLVEESAGEHTQQLKLEEDSYELKALAQSYSEMCKYLPDVKASLDSAQERLEAGEALGSQLGQLRQEFEEAKVNLIATLVHDLDFKRNSLADFDEDLDYQDLKQQIAIAQGVLQNDALPPENDIRQIRDRYRLLEQQASELREQRAQQAEEFRKRLQSQGETIESLQQTFTRYNDSYDPDAYQLLSQQLERLEKAQAEGRLEQDTLSQAREAAEKLEMAAAARAKGQEKQQAKLRALMAQVRNLPSLSQVEQQQAQVLHRLEEQLAQDTPLEDAELNQSETMLANLKEDVQTVYRHRLADLHTRAEQLDSRDILQELDGVQHSLDEGSYPELNVIEQALKQATTTKRNEQLNEIYQLEEERGQLVNIPAESEDARLFEQTLQDARQTLEAGGIVDDMGNAWSLLEAMRHAQTAQLTSFAPRLDKAMQDFEPLSKLNTNDSIKVSRILRHLDGQREAFSKVSPSMQANLEQMLSEAEALLTPLKDEYEATRDIAGKLVSSNVLDDVLSMFGGGADTPVTESESEAAEQTPAKPPMTLTEVRSGNQVLNEWVDDYLQERGIQGAIVFNREGEVLAGRTTLTTEQLFDNVKLLENDWRALGHELEVGAPRLLTIEVEDDIMIIAFSSSEDCIIILLETPSMLNLILNKLRRDIPAISDVLAGPAFA